MSHCLNNRLSTLLAIVGLLLMVVLVSACQPAKPATPAPTPTATVKPLPTPDRAAIQAAWQGSAHNNKYDLGKGPNTYCSRCHSPQNWDPAATVGKAPNCFSCKFATDKEVRIAKENPLIPETNWKPVGCDVCHKVDGGVVSSQIAIWNNGMGKYDAVATTTQLCEKCHTDSLGGTRHKVHLGGGAHSNQIGQTTKRPELCTDCHDPHSLKADCATCHAKALKPDKPISGHDAAHANVKCVACHDASGMKVRPVEGKNYWTTGNVSVRATTETFTPLTSHDFKKAVDCVRCHYDNNPWKLKSLAPQPTPSPTPKPTSTP